MINNEITVLYVDDESHNLNAFKASFRRDFNIITASSANEALRILADNTVEIHVVLTDQRMPNVTGTEFLSTLIERYPKPIRILITAYADITAVVDAINSGKVFSYISKPWDYDDLKRVITEAYHAYANRKVKDEEINYFVFKASHDIKGPLVSLKGLVDIAKANLDDKEKLSDMLNLIDKSIVSLESTLKDMIEYKRIDSTVLRDSIISFNDLIHQILADFSTLPDFNSITINASIIETIEFKNDKEVLRSIIANIIHNAIKYRKTNAANSIIDIAIETDAEKVVIDVRDNGVGMSEGTLKKAFTMFYRGHKGVEGSGLGLYIVKKGLERVFGDVEVESVIAEGSRFKLTIPNNKTKILKRENIITHTVI